MFTKKCIIVVFVFILSMSQLFAEEKAESGKIGRNMVGLCASSLSGAGLFYQYAFNDNYSFRADGIWYLNKKKESNNLYPGENRIYERKYWVAGGEIQRTLYTVDAGVNVPFSLYALVGGSYWYSKVKHPYHPEHDYIYKHYTSGLGLGGRLVFQQHLSFDASLVYQYSKYIDSIRRYAGLGGGCSVGLVF